ncbi:MAG: fibronectin type III domain-containing protein [Ignavibacteriae bacterium]|nr:fibronectin type III domain-containing protein [Ignavibacteriota bacterium]
MNTNIAAMPDWVLVDNSQTWIAENFKLAKLRGEQDLHLGNIIEYETPITPNTPSNFSILVRDTNLPQNVILSWNNVFGTDNYVLQIGDSLFTTLAIDDSTLTTIIDTVNLEKGKKYFARVRAKNTAGSSDWSNIENFTTGETQTLEVTLNDNWNMISVPMELVNTLKDSIYPTSTSQAFQYDGGYIAQESLKNGIGYWLKFSGNQTVLITGFQINNDTLEVIEGWNMIGSISTPIARSNISTNPSNMQLSPFFGYHNGYTVSDTIQPGKAYWTKSDVAGQIVLDKNNTTTRGIHIPPVPAFRSIIRRWNGKPDAPRR